MIRKVNFGSKELKSKSIKINMMLKFDYKLLTILLNLNVLIIEIFDSHKYSSLPELVEACKKNEQRGLACLLTEVCIKPRSTNAIAEGGGKWDIPRSELNKDGWKELGRGNFGIVYKGKIQF